MDISQDQLSSIDIKAYCSSSIELVETISNIGGKEQGGNGDKSPPELPERDEFLEAVLEAALAPCSGTSSFRWNGVVESISQASPLPPPREQRITFHLVRHAEGPHNLRSIPEKDRVAMLDPGLTTYGTAQSELLSQRFNTMKKVTHILSSPLSRTLLTALVAFKPAIDRGIQVILIPDLRECGQGLCNTGSNIPDLVEELSEKEMGFRKDCIDSSYCYTGWEHNTESWDEHDLRHERADRMRSMLFHLGQIAANQSNDDVEIVIVTHSRFIMALEETTNSRFILINARCIL
ncbi:hypothetical protein ONS95_008207 [Cadophora gregata]|uniref:uncharacterized protein n=1 Tax=Cadophora gregata TaxID=51156 RepID=UPI0026DC3922|nr:uncharacterized protein ONS95_008207 [Cadophora gregata]KAK0126620.1 hypothetical protein ONS95_008207 [Cadophora gregata]